jgi:hypothetical protein
LRVHAHDKNFYEYLERYTEQSRAEAFLEGYEIGSQSADFGATDAQSAGETVDS